MPFRRFFHLCCLKLLHASLFNFSKLINRNHGYTGERYLIPVGIKSGPMPGGGVFCAFFSFSNSTTSSGSKPFLRPSRSTSVFIDQRLPPKRETATSAGSRTPLSR